MLGDLQAQRWQVEHLQALHPGPRCIPQVRAAAAAHRRVVPDLVVGDLDLPQRRARLALRAARSTRGLAPQRLRSVASPSEDGGFPEFLDVIPSRASSSAIRATACARTVFSCAFSAANSSYEGGGGTGGGTRQDPNTLTNRTPSTTRPAVTTPP